jgi:hypothetical protein
MTATLIVQTPGAIVPNANTYLDVAMSDILAAKYGLTAWVDSLLDKTTPLFVATQYLESTYSGSFRGRLLEPTQPLSFPRTTFYKSNGQIVEQGAIPEELTLAQLQLAIQSLNGVDLYAPPSQNGNLKRLTEAVEGAVNRTQEWFSPNSSTSNPKYQIGVILTPILSGSSFGNRTYRA